MPHNVAIEDKIDAITGKWKNLDKKEDVWRYLLFDTWKHVFWNTQGLSYREGRKRYGRKKIEGETHLSKAIVEAYVELVGEKYANTEDLEESYSGEFDSDEDFVVDLLEGTGEMPTDLPSYIHIDMESTTRDMMYDYSEQNGFYFRNL